MRDLIEIIIQTFLAFFSILFVTRLLGRQQVKQLTFFEYITGITFGSIAADLAMDLDNKTYEHLVGLILFGALTGIIDYLTMKRRGFQKVVEGEPVLVIQDGKVLEQNLKKTRYSIDELNTLLRDKEVFTPEDVKYGLLEINGDISIMKVDNKRSVTVEDLQGVNSPDSLQTELVIGGQIIYENLKKKNLTGKSFMKMLTKNGVQKIQDVFYAALDENNNLYVDEFSDDFAKKVDLSEDNKKI